MSRDDCWAPSPRKEGDDAELDELLAAVAADAPTTPHPDPEELLDYHLAALPPAAAETVRDHLAECADCAQAVLDFEAFPDLGAPDEESAGSLHPAAERFAGHAAQSAGPPRDRRPLGWMSALAAALFLAVVGLGLRVAELERSASAPRSDLVFQALAPAGLGGVVRGAPQEVTIPSWAERVVLLLSYGGLEERERFRVELVDDAGRVLWRHENVLRRDDGTFAIEIGRRALPPGRSTLRLEGNGEAGADLLAEYPLAVLHED
jgi:hypothetical protein